MHNLAKLILKIYSSLSSSIFSVSVGVNHFTSTDGMNKLGNKKYYILSVLVCILPYVIPQRTAHFSMQYYIIIR